MNIINFLTDMGVDVVTFTDDENGKEKVTTFKGKSAHPKKDEPEYEVDEFDFNSTSSPIHY
ncbi:MAG: hypothetical protein CMB16_00495 [Euryarchaeota archaeon]|nr:hypothetical protein [Euryarchaeota archaeon]|tara:strand:+ start:3491 stop:3673 length:183 start_codon:yes stop_codon:yes gene_type:complete